jgi:hypothetical protein
MEKRTLKSGIIYDIKCSKFSFCRGPQKSAGRPALSAVTIFMKRFQTRVYSKFSTLFNFLSDSLAMLSRLRTLYMAAEVSITV